MTEIQLEGQIEIDGLPQPIEQHEIMNAELKLEKEYKDFKGSGKLGAVAKPVYDTLKLFCKNSKFAEAVSSNPNTFSQCIDKIMAGVGNSISDLEVYQRAAGFYFPNAKITFNMTIDTDGLQVPVMKKEVQATNKSVGGITIKSVPVEELLSPSEAPKIVISLDDILDTL